MKYLNRNDKKGNIDIKIVVREKNEIKGGNCGVMFGS